MIVLAAMIVPLWRLARRTMAIAATADAEGQPEAGNVLREGDAFKAFMVAYLGLRLRRRLPQAVSGRIPRPRRPAVGLRGGACLGPRATCWRVGYWGIWGIRD